ncbi:MAG: aminotransferase class I/II-fold pyridoxal phosphate-dependent enzyme [Spirochaetales bacterium]|nr:aminotransferase class I/II-fold pyridoxal phosphate-dependent enzyme [Spirochaetales bacterium]
MFAERLKSLKPYVPGEQPQDRRYVKLNTNENPYPPSPRIAALLSGYDSGRLRLYPDPECRQLKEALARSRGLKPENVFTGNGSDEVLSFAFYAFFDSPRGPLLFPRHTYSFYPVYANFYNLPFTRIPLDSGLAVCLEDYLDIPSCGVIFPNPNAPTGISLGLREIRDFLDRYPGDRAVIIDEAYIDFGGESAVELLEDYPNLLVIQTFSKGRSLAGLRLGYALGQPPLIQALTQVKDSFNSYPVDALAQALGAAALEDEAYFLSCTRRIQETRNRFSFRLGRAGWRVLPSVSNFVFASRPGISGGEVYARLKEKGYLVRYFNEEGITDFVRITIGRDEDMEALAKLMEELPAPGEAEK